VSIIAAGGAHRGSVRGFYPKNINGSLRFNDDDSAYLSWTPDSAGNRKTWTWSAWVKRGNLGNQSIFFVDRTGSNNEGVVIGFDSNDDFFFYQWNGSSYDYRLETNAVYRDPSAWYHIVCVLDTTNATANDRQKLYINGVEVTSFANRDNASLNLDGLMSDTKNHYFSRTTKLFDGYLAEVHFTDGTAYGADAFGEFKNGVWVAKTPDVTYGTNGFYLKFDVELPSFTADYLVVGGGGGGGRGGGGGGAGGFREFTGETLYKTYAYPITVGTGGAGSTSYTANADSGGDSTFVVTAAGGGGGGSHDAGTTAPSGGSGGGGGSAGTAKTGGSGNTPSVSPSQGNNGGNGSTSASAYGAGGGGGAGSVGANGTSTSGGNGGSGSTSTIDGNTYAAGGGGTGRGINDGTGGSSIGGDASNTADGGDAVASTGSGGGGCAFNASGNQGGSGSDGIILIKIPDSVTATFSGGVTQTSSTAGGYTTYTVTATSGSETVEFS
jgi:hypothetical protein